MIQIIRNPSVTVKLTGLHLWPSRVRIIHTRGGQEASELAGFFGGNIDFAAGADELAFAGAVMDLAITSADPYLNELLVANFEQALSR